MEEELMERTPDTSTLAMASHEANGLAASHRETILSYVRTFPDHTAAEIAAAVRIDRVEVGRRLPELRSAGYVISGRARKCAINGTQQMTWYPGCRRDRPQTETKQATLF